MYLSGCTHSVWFGSPDYARAAVLRLMVCHPHHFAVTGEGIVVSCSELAVQCLEDAGLIVPGVIVEEGGGE
jgi:putative component of membrane protein insertase Oxa1/YidC/SpoIIIJ protein YidD